MIYTNEGWILGVKPGEGWALHYGGWEDGEDQVHLVGFESAFDAWAFLFAHLSIDVSAYGGQKVYGRWWTFRPKEPEQKKEIKVKPTTKRRKEVKERKDTFQIGMFDE